jgi:hypothetical protein
MDVDRHPHDGIDDRQRVRSGFYTLARVLPNISLIRRELRDQRLLRHRTARGDDARGHFGIVAELNAAFFDVRTRDVDLDRIDRRVVESTRDFDIVIDRRAADIRDKARFGEVERRQYRGDDVLGTRVLQSDRIQHSHRRFVHAMRRISQAWLARRTFEHDAARVSIREALDARVFFAEPDTSR